MENLALISPKSPNPTFLPSKQCFNLHSFTQKQTKLFFVSKPTSKSILFAFSTHNSHDHIINTNNNNEITNNNAQNFDGVNFFASTSTAYTPPPKFELPLFWIGIGVGVGLSVLFSVVNSRLKNHEMEDACTTTIDFGNKKPRPARKISGATINISHLCKTENEVYLDAYIKELLPENPPKTNDDTSARRSSEDAKSPEVVQKGDISNEATSPELSLRKKTLQDIIDPELRQKVLDTMTEKDILEINRILRETGLTYEEISSRFEAASEIHLAMSNPRIQQVLAEICSSGNPMTGIKFRSNAGAMDLVMKLAALFPEITQLYGLC